MSGPSASLGSSSRSVLAKPIMKIILKSGVGRRSANSARPRFSKDTDLYFWKTRVHHGVYGLNLILRLVRFISQESILVRGVWLGGFCSVYLKVLAKMDGLCCWLVAIVPTAVHEYCYFVQ